MRRLSSLDKAVIRAMIDADAATGRDEYERFALIFGAVVTRHGLDHARRLEQVSLWICLTRDQRGRARY